MTWPLLVPLAQRLGFPCPNPATCPRSSIKLSLAVEELIVVWSQRKPYSLTGFSSSPSMLTQSMSPLSKRVSLSLLPRDYKSRWQLEKEWEEAEKARKRNLAFGVHDVDEWGVDPGDGDDNDSLPFVYFICRQPFVDLGPQWCRYGQIVEDIAMLTGFRRWDVEHVKLGANEAAHGLAKLVANVITDRISMEKTLVVFMLLYF